MSQNYKEISLDEDCTLLKAESNNKLGSKKPGDIKTPVFCCQQQISQGEYFKAGQSDIKAETMLLVSIYDYSGESRVLFGGHNYNVYRKFERPDELVELYLTARTGA